MRGPAWEATERCYLPRAALLLSLSGSLLAGCSSLPSSINPVEWWHGLEGGAIAEQRPPPPGANEPYPNLATVPEKPAAMDAAARERIAQALVADRTNAQHAAAAAPLADPSSQAASPALFGRGSAAPPSPPKPDSGAATASLEAATPPPAPASTPPARAPVAAVQSAPLAPPPGAENAEPPAQDSGPGPALPTAAPPPPSLSGVPASQPAPPTRQPAPAVAPAPAPAPPTTAAQSKPAEPVAVAFSPGSAVLPSAGSASLRQLAAKRGSAGIAVIGYGEAASSDPGAQSEALALGMSRAQAMATVLTAAGVPASAVRVDAEASGRGGAARLLD